MLGFTLIFSDDAKGEVLGRLPPSKGEEMETKALEFEEEGPFSDDAEEQVLERLPFSIKGELLRSSKFTNQKKLVVTKSFNLTGAAETEMPASLPPTGNEENSKEEQEGRMVALVVTIDEELLRRIETSGHSDFVAERTVYAEEASTENEPGEPPTNEFRPNGSLDTQAFTIDLSDNFQN